MGSDIGEVDIDNVGVFLGHVGDVDLTGTPVATPEQKMVQKRVQKQETNTGTAPIELLVTADSTAGLAGVETR